jgi:hypothetical protein
MGFNQPVTDNRTTAPPTRKLEKTERTQGPSQQMLELHTVPTIVMDAGIATMQANTLCPQQQGYAYFVVRRKRHRPHTALLTYKRVRQIWLMLKPQSIMAEHPHTDAHKRQPMGRRRRTVPHPQEQLPPTTSQQVLFSALDLA